MPALSTGAGAQVTIGQLAPGTNPAAECEQPAANDEFQGAVSSGPGYGVATGGALISWSTKAGAGIGQALSLKVLRPTALPGSYLVVAHDGPHALSPGTVNTFPVSIPVQAGDVIGLGVPAGSGAGAVPTACFFKTGNKADVVNFHETLAPDGGTIQVAHYAEFRLNVSASLLSPPTISGAGVAGGSLKGGTSVVLTGTNFASVKGVSFGAAAAASFTVSSEGQITAVSPASHKRGAVPVTVTTAAGTVTSPTTFTYEGCVVPKLRGKRLKTAKKGLKKAGCKLGKVKLTSGASVARGKVVKQSPKPGGVLAPGSTVNVTLG
jgi:hypothetical protein